MARPQRLAEPLSRGIFRSMRIRSPLGGLTGNLELSHEGIRSNKPVHAGLLYRAGKGSFRGGIIEISPVFSWRTGSPDWLWPLPCPAENDADPAIRGNFFNLFGKGYGNGQQLAVSQRSVINAVDDPAIGMKSEAAEKEGGQGTVGAEAAWRMPGAEHSSHAEVRRAAISAPGPVWGEYVSGCPPGRPYRPPHPARSSCKTGIDRYGGDMQGFQGLDDPRNLADGTFHMGDGTG